MDGLTEELGRPRVRASAATGVTRLEEEVHRQTPEVERATRHLDATRAAWRAGLAASAVGGPGVRARPVPPVDRPGIPTWRRPGRTPSRTGRWSRPKRRGARPRPPGPRARRSWPPSGLSPKPDGRALRGRQGRAGCGRGGLRPAGPSRTGAPGGTVAPVPPHRVDGRGAGPSGIGPGAPGGALRTEVKGSRREADPDAEAAPRPPRHHRVRSRAAPGAAPGPRGPLEASTPSRSPSAASSRRRSRRRPGAWLRPSRPGGLDSADALHGFRMAAEEIGIGQLGLQERAG